MDTAGVLTSTVVLVVLGCLLAAGGAVGTADQGFAQTGELDPDTTEITVSVDADGSATWTITHRFELLDETDEAAFEALAADIAENTSVYTDRFESRLEPTVSAAEEETGREMTLQNVTVRTDTEAIPAEYGLVTYEFEWTQFALVEADTIEIGDAISSFYLDSETRLEITWPERYSLQTVTPAPRAEGDQAVVWHGSETTFLSDEPRVFLRADGDSPVAGWGWPQFVLGLVLITVLFVVAIHGSLLVAGFLLSNQLEEPATPAAEGPEQTDHQEDEPTTTDEQPAELLSNEEQVLRVLDENGGRMKQQQIVESLGWTEAKTSQVITDMDEADTVEVFRIGRENVVALPEEREL